MNDPRSEGDNGVSLVASNVAWMNGQVILESGWSRFLADEFRKERQFSHDRARATYEAPLDCGAEPQPQIGISSSRSIIRAIFLHI